MALGSQNAGSCPYPYWYPMTMAEATGVGVWGFSVGADARAAMVRSVTTARCLAARRERQELCSCARVVAERAE